MQQSIEVRAEILRRSLAGERHSDLAREFGYSASGITKIVRRGLTAAEARRDRRRVDAAAIRSAVTGGASTAVEIAKVTGFTVNRVNYMLRQVECATERRVCEIRRRRYRSQVRERYAEVRRRFVEGESRRAIADAMGMTYSLVSNIVTENGKVNLTRTRAGVAARDKEILQLRRLGVSHLTIAEEFGLTVGNVSRICNQAGVVAWRNRPRLSGAIARERVVAAIEAGADTRREIATVAGLRYMQVWQVLDRDLELAARVRKYVRRV